MDGQMPTPQNEQPAQTPSPSSQNETSQEKKGLLKALALLEVGLIEVLFVGVVIILLFGTLNYFNILRLSELFPNHLGFLPHKPYEQSKQYTNVITIPTIAPATDSSIQQAKQTLVAFLPAVLDSSLLPNSSQITLEQDKNLKTTFIGSWNIKESTVAAILIVTDRKSISQFYLSVPIFNSMPPSINLASTITSELLSIKPKGTWGCKPLYNDSSYCENFWEEADGIKRGVALQGLFAKEPNLIVGQPTAMLVFCEHNKESKLYSWKSCQFEFAQTGVR